MKILELRFQNLNSLYGEWRIDFTAPEFESDGIFAITGPTGSGKSTIMDAICLALYGRTPRLGLISASENGIMSRKTGECFAEVVFASQAGRFRCRWSQHRARNRPDGKLAQAEHEISDAVSGGILESKLKDTRDAIEERTGMDFDRFTRSILLAQGGFSAFLAAKPDERAPVLEQLTGTEVYSEISRLVHERHRTETEALERLEREVAGIEVLTPEAVAALQEDLSRLEAAEKVETECAARLRDAVLWLEGLASLRSGLERVAAEASTLEREVVAFQPERERLDRGRKAAELEGAHAALTALRLQRKADREALPGLEAERKAAEVAQETCRSEQELAQAALQRAKDETARVAPLLVRVRALDLQVEAQAKAVAGLHESLENERRLARENQNLLDGATKDVQASQDVLAGIDAFLAKHAGDEVLAGRFETLGDRLEALKADSASAAARTAERDKALARLATCDADDRRLQGVLEILTTSHAAQVAAVEAKRAERVTLLDGRALREFRAERDAALRELALVNRIESLEAQRKTLEDGKPCPLCGATEHPYAAGNRPESSGVEARIAALASRIHAAENLEIEIGTLEEGAKQAESEARKAEDDRKRASFERTAAASEAERLAREIAGLEGQVAERRSDLLSVLRPLGYEESDLGSPDALRERLTERVGRWTVQSGLRAREAQRLQERQSKAAEMSAVQRTLEAPLATRNADAAAAEQVEKGLRSERRDAFGERRVDDEEQALSKAVVGCETAEAFARKRLGEAEAAVRILATKIGTLQEGLAQREPSWTAAEREFTERAAASGFAGEPAFLAASLPVEERRSLEVRSTDLGERASGISSRRKDLEERLLCEEARAVTDEDVDVLRAEFSERETMVRRMAQDMGGVRQKLAENEKAGERVRTRMERIGAARLEVGRWANLRELIGSADGKKYRNFAQGITFEMMVGHANRQLQKLTDRYLLACADDLPLELEVIDNYQGGERRSTKNLSGGESFLVSLALALGLSKMASRKVRVDSLFLDEGFGTLDEQALETALETLAGLHQDGKLIGVISHVSALKERIATRIAIVPKSGGRSTVQGPGVEAVGT